ncbi:MAG TPA: hypothetical protein VGD78_16880 [Chthoniobacterales bacterium]
MGYPQGHPHVDPFAYDGYYPFDYDLAAYAYTPSPAQQAAAQQQVAQYFAALSKKRRAAATHRYIAVPTLRPTKPQRAGYLKKRAESKATGATQPASPEQLQCVMVFDTQAKQFVGSGCYIIEVLPQGART